MKKILVVICLCCFTLIGGLTAASLVKWTQPSVAASPIAQTGAATPAIDLYLLDADNTVWLLQKGNLSRVARFGQLDGNLIGIDFRVSDGQLYGLTDTGGLFILDVIAPQIGQIAGVGRLSPRFAGGIQSLIDFNPVVDAMRLIGSNDQNFAVLINSGTSVATTVLQTAVSYAAGDVNARVDPNLSGGAYTNNYVGAANTLFYGLDYDLNTLVTIQPAAPGGSSATGAGRLQTIGRIVDNAGNPVNLTPTSDLDVYTDANRVNYLGGLSGRVVFTIDLSQINPALPLGTTQDVKARAVTINQGEFIDLAAKP